MHIHIFIDGSLNHYISITFVDHDVQRWWAIYIVDCAVQSITAKDVYQPPHLQQQTISSCTVTAPTHISARCPCNKRPCELSLPCHSRWRYHIDKHGFCIIEHAILMLFAEVKDWYVMGIFGTACMSTHIYFESMCSLVVLPTIMSLFYHYMNMVFHF